MVNVYLLKIWQEQFSIKYLGIGMELVKTVGIIQVLKNLIKCQIFLVNVKFNTYGFFGSTREMKKDLRKVFDYNFDNIFLNMALCLCRDISQNESINYFANKK